MTSSDPSPEAGYVPPLASRLFKGSALMIAMRWVVRLLGLANTAILARLLMPDDFGVVGFAIIMAGLVESVTNVGVSMSLIQNTQAERKHYDSAWTIQIGQAIVVASILFAVAPFANEYFGDDRVSGVVYLTALGGAICGFANIGIVDFRKKLQFNKDFLYTTFTRLGYFIVTAILAFWLRSYWAIAIGYVGGGLIELGLSYVMSSYRPRLSVSAVKELWSFSQWMLALSIISYLIDRGERFIIGRLVNTATFGYYGVGYDLAMMPTLEIVMPIARTVDATIAMIRHEIERLRNAVINLLSVVMLLCVPTSIGFLMVSREFVTIVLGEPWLPALPIVQAAAIASILEMPVVIINGVLIRADHVRTVGILTGIQMLLVLAVIYPAYHAFGLTGVIYAKAVVTALALVAVATTLARHAGIRFADYLGVLVRPTLGTIAMAFAVYGVSGFLGDNVVASLIIKAAVGAIAYATVVSMLWIVSGRPEGAEDFIFGKLQAGLGLIRS